MPNQLPAERNYSRPPRQRHDLKPDGIIEHEGEPPDPEKISRSKASADNGGGDSVLPEIYRKAGRLPAVQNETNEEKLPVKAELPGALTVAKNFSAKTVPGESEKKNRAEPPRRFAARFRERLENLLGRS